MLSTSRINAFEQLRAETPILQADAPKRTAASTISQVTATTRPVLPPDEQAILDLVGTYGRVTAKLITEQLNVSRATATRRLRALAETDHLTQQGKGRGTYYTSATESTVPNVTGATDDANPMPMPNVATGDEAAAPLQAEVEAQLAAHRAILRERFGVATIMPTTAPHASTMPRLIVQFSQVPSLPEFCLLRAYLTENMGMEVDLWPDL